MIGEIDAYAEKTSPDEKDALTDTFSPCWMLNPGYQGKGAGTLLMNAVEAFIQDTIAPGWAVSLELISTKEAVPFYHGKGFEERPCDWDGPGMFKMIKRE